MTIKIDQKTFKVIDGTVSISMFDTQKRISKLKAIANEKGWKVVYTK